MMVSIATTDRSIAISHKWVCCALVCGSIKMQESVNPPLRSLFKIMRHTKQIQSMYHNDVETAMHFLPDSLCFISELAMVQYL